MLKNLPAVWEIWVQSLGQEDSLSTLVFLPGKSHGQRSLAGYIVQGVAKSERLTHMKHLGDPVTEHESRCAEQVLIL